VNEQTSANLEAERAALHARSEGVVAAEVAFDVPEALTYWAEDAILQPAGAPQIEGKEAIRGVYKQYFESGLLREFAGSSSHIEISSAGDLAYEYGVNRMVLAGESGDLVDVGKYLAIWKKIDGEWMVVALSFTSDAPAPSPISG
jgi:ketosteroid isomerase-like protein